MATAAYFIGMQIRMRREATRSDRSNPASNDVNLPGLATTETLTHSRALSASVGQPGLPDHGHDVHGLRESRAGESRYGSG